MTVSFKMTSRGSGKIYVHVSLDMSDRSQSVDVEARTSDGRQVPAVLYPLQDAGEFVLAVCVLSVAQVVSLIERDAKGNELSRLDKTIDPLRSKVISKANTFLRVQGVSELRNYDQGRVSGYPHVEVDGIHDSFGRYVRGRIVLPVCGTDQAQAKPEVHMLDVVGRDIGRDSLETIATDSVQWEPDGVHGLRTIRFCVACASDYRGQFSIWARFPGSGIPDGFQVIEGYVMPGLLLAWNGREQQNMGADPFEYWFLHNHRTSQRELFAQRSHRFAIEPSFSIIVPLFKTPLSFFNDMVDSVLAQTYGNFELILVNASPEDEGLGREVARRQETDSRIKCVALEGNRGITENTNEGIKAATGDFLAFFDHDDILEPDILFQFVRGINDYPQTDLLYCDEDLYENGHYWGGFLKPDFDWERICRSNYITHMLTVRKSIVDSLELPTKEFDGSQDHNMTLRVAEKARNVYHARKILYHWRVHQNSASSGIGAKPYALEAGRRAIESHMRRCGYQAEVSIETPSICHYRVDYEPDESQEVSVVLPALGADTQDVCKRCLGAVLEKTSYRSFEVLVVLSDETTQDAASYLEGVSSSDPRVRIVRMQGAPSRAQMANEGTSAASGSFLLFMDMTTDVRTTDWMTRLVGPCARPEVGVVGARILYPDGEAWSQGIILPKSDPMRVGFGMTQANWSYQAQLKTPGEYCAVSGACMLTTRAAFDSASGFDEAFSDSYGDVDYCLRLWDKGVHTVLESTVEVVRCAPGPDPYLDLHDARVPMSYRERVLLMERHPRYYALGDAHYGTFFVAGDPYYSLQI